MLQFHQQGHIQKKTKKKLLMLFLTLTLCSLHLTTDADKHNGQGAPNK